MADAEEDSTAPPEVEESEPVEPPAKRQRPVKLSEAKFALKILCNDDLTKTILGVRGKKKDDTQEKCRVRMTFSNKGDYFPNTYFRVLMIYGEEIEGLMAATRDVLESLLESGNKERETIPQHDWVMVGKEPEEFIFRLCLSKNTASLLIGSGGKNIKQIRDEVGIKIFIENETVCGHQMARIIGEPDKLLEGVEKVNEYIQQDAGSEAYIEWANILNFSEQFGQGPQHPGAGNPVACKFFLEGKCKKGSACTFSHQTEQATYGGYERPASHTWEGQLGPPSVEESAMWKPPAKVDTFYDHRGASNPPAVASNWHGEEEAPRGDDGIEDLVQIVSSMPEGAAQAEYQVHSSLAAGFFERLEDILAHVEETTGARVEPREEEQDESSEMRSFQITGPLMSIYAAHAMIMKRVAELDEQDRRGASGGAPSVEELQAQINALKEKLDEVSQLSGAAKSSSGGAARSSSGKGKSSGKGPVGGGESKGKGKKSKGKK